MFHFWSNFFPLLPSIIILIREPNFLITVHYFPVMDKWPEKLGNMEKLLSRHQSKPAHLTWKAHCITRFIKKSIKLQYEREWVERTVQRRTCSTWSAPLRSRCPRPGPSPGVLRSWWSYSWKSDDAEPSDTQESVEATQTKSGWVREELQLFDIVFE